jgi:hypothetical protein
MTIKSIVENQVYHEMVCHTFLFAYLYPDCILVLKNPDDDHRCDQNMLVKNNTTNTLMKEQTKLVFDSTH